MSRLIASLPACLLVVCVAQGISQSGLPKRIPLRMFGFSIETPVGWRAGLGKEGLPIFVNFEWSKMQAQLRLPAGGATINIIAWANIPRRRGDESLMGWAHLDGINAAPETFSSGMLDVPSAAGISEALVSTFNDATFGPDDQPRREVSAYWAFRDEKFAAHLSYVIGDPKGATYENVLRQVVSSIRPLE